MIIVSAAIYAPHTAAAVSSCKQLLTAVNGAAFLAAFQVHYTEGAVIHAHYTAIK